MMQQQPIPQQDQIGSHPGMAQQMVLCPVRVVYETQILLQPGEQIPPNQTIFINPHNPPPWVQNRAQNQVLYVHHMPNNMVSNVQQHVDQNPMYIQNYSYQIPQQIMTPSPQEQRPMQITNMPQQMIQNVTNNMQNERVVQMPNYGPLQNQMVPNRQIMSNVTVNQMPNHTVTNQTAVDMQRQYMNVRPQISQNVNVRQIMAAQNAQNIQQNIAQTFTPNVVQRPMHVQNNSANIQRMIKPTTPNVIPNVQVVPKGVQTFVSDVNTNNTISVPVSNVRNVQNQAYRPIQPRPQFRHNMPNIGSLTQPGTRMQNMQANIYNRPKDNRVPTTHTVTSVTNHVDNYTQHNRKRKSESPDEIHKKMISNPAMRGNETVLVKQQGGITMKTVVPSNDIGVNTSPVHKNKFNQSSIVQILNNSTPIVKSVDNGQQTNQNDTSTKPNATNHTKQVDKEKLLRNTVYPQARGRLLKDKEIVPVTTDNVLPQDVGSCQTINERNENSPSILQSYIEMPATIKETYKTAPISEISTLMANIENAKEITVTKIDNSTTDEQEDEKISLKEQIKFKDTLHEGQQILTHVLDGFVIQESNMAFPIRKPLKERTVRINTLSSEDQPKDTNEDESNKPKTETVEDRKPIDLPLLPLYYLHLNNNKEESNNEDSKDCKKENTEDKPFANVEKTTVKTWMVDQLGKYLLTYGWTETVALLQEHEIDGESLFLVSKAQLLSIGINEEHADVICEYVNNEN